MAVRRIDNGRKRPRENEMSDNKKRFRIVLDNGEETDNLAIDNVYVWQYAVPLFVGNYSPQGLVIHGSYRVKMHHGELGDLIRIDDAPTLKKDEAVLIECLIHRVDKEYWMVRFGVDNTVGGWIDTHSDAVSVGDIVQLDAIDDDTDNDDENPLHCDACGSNQGLVETVLRNVNTGTITDDGTDELFCNVCQVEHGDGSKATATRQPVSS